MFSELYATAPAKKYYLTAAPQCPYPDGSNDLALQSSGNLFDFVFIQYYNNPGCSGSRDLVVNNFNSFWAPLCAPKLLLSWPAKKGA